MVLVPALLVAAAVVAPGCDVTGATLDWGFKESFRAYIDSDIANGEWTTEGLVTYTTPDFAWTDGVGRYDPATGSGYIDFSGSVRFTGHEGLLDTTIANPTVALQNGTATLLLDVTGATMEGDMIDTEDVSFVTLSTGAIAGDDAVRTLDADTALTADGATAFPNYAAGDAFDPVSVSMNVSKQCAVALADGDAIDNTGDVFTPINVGVGLFALLAAAAAAFGLLYATRRRRA